MANATASNTEALIKQAIYIAEGFLILLTNAIILLVIGRNKQLRQRKELCIMAVLAVSDTFFGVAYFHAGIRRFLLFFNGEGHLFLSAWSCLWHLHTWGFTLGNLSNPTMLLIIAMDRYIAIAWFKWYFSQQMDYVKRIAMALGVFTVVGMIVVVATTYSMDRVANARYSTVKIVCLTPYAMPTYIANSLYGQACFMGWFSIFAYCAVLASVKRYERTQLSEAQRENFRKQAKITRTIFIIAGSNFVLYTLPQTAFFYINVIDKINLGLFHQYIYMILALNSMNNAVILTWKQKDFRRGVMRLLKCQQAISFQPFKRSNNTVSTVNKNDISIHHM